jgi:acetyl-CoA acyltransferase
MSRKNKARGSSHRPPPGAASIAAAPAASVEADREPRESSIPPAALAAEVAAVAVPVPVAEAVAPVVTQETAASLQGQTQGGQTQGQTQGGQTQGQGRAGEESGAPVSERPRRGPARPDRVAIVAGLRTPFQKQGTGLQRLSAADLGTAVVAELLQRTELSPAEIGLCVYGQVVPSLDWLNIAREVVLRSGLPRGIDAYSVSRACATSIQAMTSAAETILGGQHDAAIAGGADSMSDVPLGVSRALRNALVAAQKGRTPLEKIQAFRGLKPADLVPPIPGFSREPTTGEQMGEAAEKMAKQNGISRRWQDEIALASHQNAARAWQDGTYAAEVMTVLAPPYREAVSRDNIVRGETTLDALAKLKPAFDRAHGTITAGNASPLTDGASALLVMRESKAKALGYAPLGYLKSWAYAAVDPSWQLLMGPVFAAPKALDRAGLSLAQMDLIDMHEAFAAQVASNIQAFESATFARERLGRSEAIGEVDRAKLNVNGGSIAIGHPFAATGGRMVLSSLRALKKRGGQHALLTLCAAGGLGAAVVLEAGE